MASITTKIVRDPNSKDPRRAHLPDAVVNITSDFNRPETVEDYKEALGEATCAALLQKAYDLKAHNFHLMFVLKNMKRVSADGEPEVWEYQGTPEQLAAESSAFKPEKRERSERAPRERKPVTVDKVVGDATKLDDAGKEALRNKLREMGII